MPEYDVACPTCGFALIVHKTMQEPIPRILCPICCVPLERQYHPVHVTLVEEGFYTSDNRSEIEKHRFKHLWKD